MTRVLVVDDDAPIRLLCRVNLEAEGIEVLEAGDGRAGLEAARKELPDVILLDVMLPQMDGWQVADYVTKPFNPVELAPLIRDLLGRVERGERDELRRQKLIQLRALADGH